MTLPVRDEPPHPLHAKGHAVSQQRVVTVSEASNTLGLTGFILSIVGFMSCGLLSPIGLLLSFIGLFKQPRAFAIAGFVIGLIGSLWLLIALAFGLFAILLAALGLAAEASSASGYSY